MDSFNQFSTASSLFSASIIAVIYFAVVALYRITLHPLAKIPGPRLAAVTQLYQTFYCYYKGQSRFYKQIELLHKQYGPVVRITPTEVSLSDPANYEKIYYVGTRFSKDPAFYFAFGANAAAFTTPGNELHRVRRAALNPMFLRKVVLELEDVVQEKVTKLLRRLKAGLKSTDGVDLHYGFRAVSVDVITDYAFNDCYHLLDRHDFGKPFFAMVKGTTGAFWIFQQWPIVQSIVLRLPSWLIFNPSVRAFLRYIEEARKKISEVKTLIEKGEKSSRRSIFHQLLDPNATEGHVVPNVDELVDEALVLVAAASDTTGNAMTKAAYNVLNDPQIYAKVKEELRDAFPDEKEQLSFTALEKLPYLTGVVKEGLRLSFGVIGRLPRVVPENGAEFNGHFISAGSVVGMSSWTMHTNPSIFPNPFSFDPTRWLNPERARFQEKYLVAFSKGSRQCIGFTLAYCELYVTLGTLFRRFEDLRVHNVRPEDLVYDDFFSSYNPDNARKFHVIGA